jgi:ribosome-associated protein
MQKSRNIKVKRPRVKRGRVKSVREKGSKEMPVSKRVKGLKEAVAACVTKKAEDVVMLDMRKLCSFTEYFIIASGESSVQTKAIANAVTEKLKKENIKIYHNEGREQGNWIVLDAGRFIIHLFLKEMREFYNLELLWADAPKVNYGKTAA